MHCSPFRRWLVFASLLLMVAVGFPVAVPASPTAAQSDERCFAETGYCIAGRIRSYWEQHGGVPVFGYPITPQRDEVIEGQPRTVQWFERNRFELHPENAAPYDVLLGRLGVDALTQQGRDWQTFEQAAAAGDGCRYFAETRQNVCGAILAAWRANGLELDGRPGFSEAENLALWGLPISPQQSEPIEGQTYAVQWFERARFELHPENAAPYDVLLGRLGNALVQPSSNPAPTLPATPRPPANVSATWPQLRADLFVSGLVRPAHISNAGDGSGRLFVIEQEGRIRIIDNNSNLLPEPFLDITDRVGCCGERGLLSVVFPPNYASKGYFYVNYTASDGTSRVSRFGLTGDPNRADPASETLLLTLEQPYANHNGGQMAFGPNDGYLYIGFGDGGGGGDPQNRAQDPQTLLGKILRIDVEADTNTYVVPSDNPFVDNPAYRPEIWATGLRNPWRFSFDRATGDLYIADVGQEQQEEINFQAGDSSGGENYGWRIMEGNACYNPSDCESLRAGLTMPVVAYDHSDGNCSVTGGLVYRGTASANMQGIYYYGDFCTGQIWGLRRLNGQWENNPLLDAPFTITTFGEDEAGNLYVASYTDGTIYRLTE